MSTLIPCAGCSSTRSAATVYAEDVSMLASWMTGSFSSAEQAAKDPDNFFPVTLQMVPIWTDRNDGPWLYIEQALESTRDAPYRQRIYRLGSPNPGVYTSAVYELPEPAAFIGGWRTPRVFDGLSPSDLDLRDGCTISMVLDGDRFVGGTDGTGCTSSLRGADHATSEVEILPDRLLSWDRGFNAAGEQVWGAAKGGYVFLRTDG